MSYKFGSARHDEHGACYKNGSAGDQTGQEVTIQNFYKHTKGWNVIRAKNTTVASNLAERMTAACNNDNIGYDQNQRTGIIKTGIDTKTKTECDCSSLVRECIREAATIDPGNFTTETEAQVLKKTKLFYDPMKYTDGMILYDGDILVTCTKGHTGIIVSGNPREKTKSYEEVALEVIAGVWGNGLARRQKLTAAGYDYQQVQKLVNKLVKG